MKIFKPIQPLFILLLALWACIMPVASWAAPPDMPPGLEKKLMDQAITHGSARVIVGMKLTGRPFELEGKLPDQAARGQQRANIAKAAKALRGEMQPLQARINREYVTLPYMAMSVNANALDHLLKSPRITSIEEDQERELLNASASPFVGANSTWAAGFGGKGTAVAILDTGIDNDHPFFLGGGLDGDILRIVDEACFSDGTGDTDVHSLCPDLDSDSDWEYGPGSADATVAACFNGAANLCTHGTHVAGIAAGQDDPLNTDNNNYDGIAPEAGIVAVQVFHRTDDCNPDAGGDQPCVTTWDSDFIAGLDWVQDYALPRHNVVSANMSLGGGIHTEPCGGSSSQTAIANLRSAGVATAVASGNDGWTWAISFPACAPDAVTVGAVSDANYDVWYNMSKDVDITASGRSMDSSVPDDVYSSKSGTSMATPQVTGAFAVLKAIDPSMTIDEAEQLLKDTGFLVMDQRDAFPLTGDDDYPEDCEDGDENPLGTPECQPYTRIVKPLLQLDIAVAAITESDLGIYKDCKPDGDKLTGEEALCFLTVTNYGEDAAMDVAVSDTYISDGSADFTLGTPVLDPADAGSCVVSGNPQNPSGQVTCDLGAMQSGEVVNITIPVSADDPINVDDNATVFALTPDPFLINNASTDGLVFIAPTADLEVQKICKPDGDAVVGEDTGKCEIFITNHGPSIAENVTLVDEIFATVGSAITVSYFTDPAGLVSGCSQPDKDVHCDLGNMDPGDVIKVTVTVTSTEANDVNDLATATSDTDDSDTSNNSDQGQIHFVLPTSDLQVTKDCQPDGDLLTGVDGNCTIIVTNFGPSVAANVDVVDTHSSNLPFTIDGVTPGCVINGDVVNCSFASIVVGASETIVVTIQEAEPMDINDTVTVSHDTEDPDTSNNTASDGLHIVEDANLRVSKLCKPDGDLLAGVTGTCQIIVENLGPSIAENVTVVDTHTSNLPFTIDLVTPGCAINGDIVNCAFLSIAVGASETIVVSIAEDEPMDINDTVSVSSDMFDSDLSNNIAADGLHIVGLADLSITKSDGPDPVPAGTNLTYTLTVTNDGPSTARNVLVSDQVPAGVVMVSAIVAGGPGSGSCVMGVPDNALQPTLCGIGDLASLASATVTIVVAVLPDSTGLLHNDASVSSDTLDNDNSDNQVTADSTIVVVTSLDLVKTADKLEVTAGSELKYLLSLTNGGPSTATMVKLVDTLPPETSLVKTKVLGGNGDCVQSAANPDVVTCTLGDMDPGESFLVVITVLVDPSVPHGQTIRNDAVVTEDSGPGDSDFEETLVKAEADLWIDKTGLFLTENPSKTIRYTLTVHNDTGCSGDDPQVCGPGGPSDAQDVVVVDSLPSTAKKLVVTFVSEDCLYSKGTHEVTCTMQTPLAAGDSVFFEIEATPRGRLRAITNTATVTTSTYDPDIGNDTDDMLIIVGGGGQK